MKSILLLETNGLFLNKRPALGLLTLHSFLKSKNVKSKYVDILEALKLNSCSVKVTSFLKSKKLAKDSFRTLKEDIINYDSIGISVSYKETFNFVKSLCRLIKTHFPNKKIIIGGKHITMFYLEGFLTLNYFKKYFDFVIILHGEIPLYLFLKKNFKEIDKIPNLIFVKNNTIKINEIKDSLNLDCLPIIKESCDDKIFEYETGRGCYWHKCSFCAYNYNSKIGLKYKEKSVKKIIADLKQLKPEIDGKTIRFVNDSMSINQALNLSNGIIKEKLSLSWFSYIRFEKSLSFEILKKMKDAGCLLIWSGLESGDPKVNSKIMNKGIDLKDVERILRDCKRLGLYTLVLSVTGVPGETLTDALKTSNFFLKNKENINMIRLFTFKLKGYNDYCTDYLKYNILKVIKWRGRYFFIPKRGFFYKTLLMPLFVCSNYLYFNMFTNVNFILKNRFLVFIKEKITNRLKKYLAPPYLQESECI